jgi:ParB-like chromosome segregation protein Spo0J
VEASDGNLWGVAGEAQMISSDIQRIDIGRLEFDAFNPRLPRTVDGRNQTAVLSWMLEDASLLELMRSIAIQDYFPGEPLLVVPLAGDRAVVVEGNRRLAAARLLAEPRSASVRKVAVREIADEACGVSK